MPLAANGPWRLPVDGYEILTIIFGYPLDVIAYGDEGASAAFRFGGPFRLVDAGGAVHELDAEKQSWEELAVVLALRHDTIDAATATEQAELGIRLASGRVLSVRQDDSPYENWEVTGSDFKLVATPGGEVAIWGKP